MIQLPLDFKLVDAFARSPYTGNVAGVVLDADGLSDRQMQAIANEFAAPETTFILPATTKDASLRFRWFTPGCETDFCGHATLGAVHALWETGRLADLLRDGALPIECKAGIVTVRVDHSGGSDEPPTIWIDMPDPRPKSTNVPVPAIAHHLGLSMDAVDPKLPAIRTRDDDFLIAVKEVQTLLALAPSMSELAKFCNQQRIRGVFVTSTHTLSRATVAQSRFFAPAAGVDEDPVTGSAHGPLGLHLVECGIVPLENGKADFLCAQAKAGGRAGIVYVNVTQSKDGTKFVRVGGTCVTTASGKIERLITD